MRGHARAALTPLPFWGPCWSRMSRCKYGGFEISSGATGFLAYLLIGNGREVFELEDIDVFCEPLIEAKDPPPLGELQREVALLLQGGRKLIDK
jgi:hypothetical protein